MTYWYVILQNQATKINSHWPYKAKDFVDLIRQINEEVLYAPVFIKEVTWKEYARLEEIIG